MTGKPIKDRGQEQSGDDRPEDLVLNLQKHFSYHKSLWTKASNHMLLHNICSIEGIASAALFSS